MKVIQDLARKNKTLTDGLHRRRIGLLIFSLVIGSLVVACSGSTLADQSTDQADDAEAARLSQTEEFGLSKEGLVTNIEAVETAIAACMSDAGFEYIGVDYNTVRQGMTGQVTPL